MLVWVGEQMLLGGIQASRDRWFLHPLYLLTVGSAQAFTCSRIASSCANLANGRDGGRQQGKLLLEKALLT